MSKYGSSGPKTLLRAERLARQWSQQELADRVGTSVVTINRWERGVTTPAPYYRLKLCALFEKDAVTLGLLPPATTSLASSAPLAETRPHLTIQAAAATLPASSSLCWQVPFRRNPFFTGRTAVLDHLHTLLNARSQPVLALSGLGGIGKTQTAIEYAYRFSSDYQTVLWLRAETETILRNDCIRLATGLSLTTQTTEQASNGSDSSGAMGIVRDWLDRHEHWLLILDNIEEWMLVEQVLPLFLHGHVLITTRIQAIGPLAQHIDLRELPQEESMQLLLHRSRLSSSAAQFRYLSSETRQAIQTLSQALDGLPLALDQAAAYIEETGCSFTDYLTHYQRHRLALLGRRGSHHMEHPASVVATVSLCVEQLAAIDPAAVDLLYLCSFLPPEGVSEEFLHDAASTLGPRLATLLEDLFLFDITIGNMRALSLLYRQATSRRLVIHRLVQAVLRDRLDDQARLLWATRIVQAVNQVFPRNPALEQIARCEQLLPYAHISKALIVQQQLLLPESWSVLYYTGCYLIYREHYAQAEEFLSLARQQQEQAETQDNLHLAATCNELGLAYEAQGKYAMAAQVYQYAQKLYASEFSPAHPTMLELSCHLGRLTLRQGYYRDAERYLQRAITLGEPILHSAPTYLIMGLQLISTLYHQLGKYTEAEATLQLDVALYQEYFGITHPGSIECLCQLSIMYSMHNKEPQASKVYQQCLEFLNRGIAQGDQLTASCLKHLGIMYSLQGEEQQAETLLRQALAICQRSFGEIHPDTADCLHALATLARQQGKYQLAEALLVRTSTILTQFYGPTHPDTAEMQIELGTIFSLQGHHQQAEELLQQACDLLTTAFGLEHISTIESIHALGMAASRQGKYAQARDLLIRVLTLQERIFASTSPHIATTRNEIANTNKEQNG